jgi:hypothetical protein
MLILGYKVESAPERIFAANLPTPTPPLKREGGGSAYIRNDHIYRYLLEQKAPLPAGREGLGVGRLTINHVNKSLSERAQGLILKNKRNELYRCASIKPVP